MSASEISPKTQDDTVSPRSHLLIEKSIERMQDQILIVHGPTNTGKTFLLQQLQTELSKTHDVLFYSAKTHRDTILAGPTTWWPSSIDSENQSPGHRAVLIDDAHLLYDDYVFWYILKETRWFASPEPLICVATRYVTKGDNTGATYLEVNVLLQPVFRHFEYRTISLEVAYTEELPEGSGSPLPLRMSFRETQEWIAGAMEDRGYRPTEWTGLVPRLYGIVEGHFGALKVMTDWFWPAERADRQVGISEEIYRVLAALEEILPTSSLCQTPEAGLLPADKPSDSVRHPNDESGELMKVLSSHIRYLGLPTDDHLRDDSVREVLQYVLQQKNPYKKVEGDGLEVCLQEGYLIYRGFAEDGYQFPSRLHHFFCHMMIFGKEERWRKEATS